MLAPWKKRSYDQPRQHIKKHCFANIETFTLRHYFANKGLSSQSYNFSSSHIQIWKLVHKEGWAIIFPVVIYKYESWIIKKAECRRIDAFKLWCWRRLFRVLWTAKQSKQLILKEINPEYSLEGLILKLKLNSLATWCEELTHLKRLWCWESLRAGGEGDDREWDGWMASLTQCTWFWVNSGSWW